jgi:hypothetical protein
MSHPAPAPAPRRARSRRRGGRHDRRHLLVASVAALVVSAAVVLAVDRTRSGPDLPRGAGDATGAGSPSPPSVDLAALPIERGPFCGDLARGDVESALAGPVTRSSRYGPGQRVLLTPGVRDVSHEYGCTYTTRTGAQGRVWVFAEPVSRRAAAALVRDARSLKGCRATQGGPAFGDPAVRTECPASRRAGTEVALHGLFGDAWLSCQLTTASGSAAESVRRAERWCVQVATALGTRDG